ncbi:Cytochrome bd-II ubiquinol oxidase subunit 1 [Pseudomonas fluorescens]|uniref:cytochrome ubiquinol oxidase subunit I n=1 Tax=Pseudomonas fluorescens TaxID=294 RepID=UPI001251723B|nr:cytochrome ubiquinol oxidase subunit I [Pseudomonas fluorescens]CAG8865722.1 Cytochrome bd-II ubiquinol oxidase subunit 1 [Pseudomonas fluorescens]
MVEYGDAAAALLAARAQFAITISFHIVLAAFSIGLAQGLMVLEALWLWRKRQVYMDVYHFWLKVFALTVAVGTASGLIMEYQFGLNWSRLSAQAGGIIGPLMFYEVMVAFFLEAGFLGIMLFGLKKVGPRLHFLATCAVAFGALVSAFWILSANSWMHTPAGYSIDANGRFIAEDWWAIVFNPSFPYRLTHMIIAALMGSATMVAGTGAWQLLREPGNPRARLQYSMALWTIAVLAPLQIVVGDLHGQHTLEVQPIKIAAIEGSWHRPAEGAGEPLRLFALPDMSEQRNHFEVAIARIGSLYLTHDLSGTIRALDEFDPADLPPVPIVFFAFRVMVGLGLLMAAQGVASLVLRWRGRLVQARWLQHASVILAPAGFLAMLSGWVVTEVGRQPFTIQGLLRTADSVSPVSAHNVVWATVAILMFYTLVFGVGLWVLLRLLRQPPRAGEPGPQPGLSEDN